MRLRYLSFSCGIFSGVEHLANAVTVCGQPTELLQVLQHTLPAEIFTLLIRRMKGLHSKVSQAAPQPELVANDDDL